MKDADVTSDFAKQDRTVEEGVQLFEGDTLAVGETVWLFARSTKKKTSKKELDRYVDFVDDRLGVQVTYCSRFARLGQCWQSTCSLPNQC
jgi:hypothetical protein